MKRPNSFASFFGQEDAVGYLRVAVRSAVARSAVFGHTLMLGPAGVGKTTLAASVLPTELGCQVQVINCAAISKAEELTRKLVTVPEGSILFLDEIHALISEAREHLLTLMEDRTLTVVVPDQEPMTVILPEFTIIGATTRVGNLDAPLRGRFKHSIRLSTYTDVEMVQVLKWIAESYDNLQITEAAINMLVEPIHGVARMAVTMIEACIDTLYGNSGQGGVVDEAIVADTLKRLGYVAGLNPHEIRYIKALGQVSGGKLGLATLAAMLDETPTTVEEVYEPYLLRSGIIEKTGSGRKLGPQAVGKLFYV